MTVKQIVSAKNVILATGFVIIGILVGYFHNIWAMLLAVAFCIFWYYLEIIYIKRAWARLRHIKDTLLDPKLYEKEMNDYTKLLNNRYYVMKYVCDVTLLDMQGHFREAADICSNLKYKKAQAQKNNNCNQIYHYCRAGESDKAAPLLRYLEESLNEHQSDTYFPSLCHTMGLYYLETGNFVQAHHFLNESLISCQMISLQMHIHFDLGCLEEKEANLNIAIEHYRQATTLGPKTWMGQ